VAWVWDDRRALELVRYTFAQSVPLPGFDSTVKNLEDFLFPGPLQKTVLVVLAIAHKFLALLFLFLIGLALRNLFKMK
jgi:hypothetical protein